LHLACGIGQRFIGFDEIYLSMAYVSEVHARSFLEGQAIARLAGRLSALLRIAGCVTPWPNAAVSSGN
jgi:hypothetical protein